MKWVCWECGQENHYHFIKAVQDKCPHCGAQLKISQAPLASSSILLQTGAQTLTAPMVQRAAAACRRISRLVNFVFIL